MTVKELIKLLKTMPQDIEVISIQEDGWVVSRITEVNLDDDMEWNSEERKFNASGKKVVYIE